MQTSFQLLALVKISLADQRWLFCYPPMHSHGWCFVPNSTNLTLWNASPQGKVKRHGQPVRAISCARPTHAGRSHYCPSASLACLAASRCFRRSSARSGGRFAASHAACTRSRSASALVFCDFAMFAVLSLYGDPKPLRVNSVVSRELGGSQGAGVNADAIDVAKQLAGNHTSSGATSNNCPIAG